MKLTRGGTMYDQRDIVIIPFPYTDLTGAKNRPALIISNEKLNKTEDKICCLITSNSPKEGIVIDETEGSGLPFKSWVKPHRLFTINERIIKKRICKVSLRYHKKIIVAVNDFIK